MSSSTHKGSADWSWTRDLLYFAEPLFKPLKCRNRAETTCPMSETLSVLITQAAITGTTYTGEIRVYFTLKININSSGVTRWLTESIKPRVFKRLSCVAGVVGEGEPYCSWAFYKTKCSHSSRYPLIQSLLLSSLKTLAGAFLLVASLLSYWLPVHDCWY